MQIKIIVLFFIVLMVGNIMADTNVNTYFVRYIQETGVTTAYDKDFPYTSYKFSSDGTYFTGMIADLNVRLGLFSTTNDPDPKLRENISQFPDAFILLHPKEDYIQAVKTTTLKLAENKFMDVCESIIGQKVKLGFDEIQEIIEPMQTNNPEMFMGLSIKLLAIDSELKREGGVKWWDDCIYHPEVVGMAKSKNVKNNKKGVRQK